MCEFNDASINSDKKKNDNNKKKYDFHFNEPVSWYVSRVHQMRDCWYVSRVHQMRDCPASTRFENLHSFTRTRLPEGNPMRPNKIETCLVASWCNLWAPVRTFKWNQINYLQYIGVYCAYSNKFSQLFISRSWEQPEP